MALIINGIFCDELVANFGEGFDLLGGPTARKGFICDWSDRYTVATGLIGLSTTVSIGGVLTIQTPAQYPERSTMYAHSIEISGAGPPFQGGAQIAFPKAIIWCNYACMPWSFTGIEAAYPFMQIDPATPLVYCKQNIDTSTTWMTIPGRGLKFFSSNNPLKGVNFAVPIFQAEIQLTFIRVPYFPAQQIFAAGTDPVNSTSFLGLAAGHVFFNGSHSEQTRDSEGNMTLDLTYSFSFRALQWDMQWDAVAQVFDGVVDLSGTPIIGRSDLNSLLIVGY